MRRSLCVVQTSLFVVSAVVQTHYELLHRQNSQQRVVTKHSEELSLPPSVLPDQRPPSGSPADKRCSGEVAVIVGLCSRRWQKSFHSLDSNERTSSSKETLTSLDCITIRQA